MYVCVSVCMYVCVWGGVYDNLTTPNQQSIVHVTRSSIILSTNSLLTLNVTNNFRIRSFSDTNKSVRCLIKISLRPNYETMSSFSHLKDSPMKSPIHSSAKCWLIGHICGDGFR